MWWRGSIRPRTPHRDVFGVVTAKVSNTTRCPLPLDRAPTTPTSACASQHLTAHTPTVRRQTPTYACAVERDVRQPRVFTAPPLQVPAQVVILAQALMGPHSTQVTIALAEQRHVILSMACTATLKQVSVPSQFFQICVPFVMVPQQTLLHARAGV